MADLAMIINGENVQAKVDSRTLLVDFLRDTCRLTGTHVGCDTSQCGACVVHVNGHAVKACTMLAVEAQGAAVTTIEGMSAKDANLGAVQAAFQTHHGLQCGFCTPGMVMTAAALLAETPRPTEVQIREHLEGNLCRCTGYQNIVKAIMAASGQSIGRC